MSVSYLILYVTVCFLTPPDEPVEEPRRRVPGMRPGGLGMGPPAGMGGMLAEMQAKRASMNPLASKVS